MSQMTTKRVGNCRRIFWGDEYVGEAFKFTCSPGFGLRLKGVYWRKDGSYNRRGGGSTHSFRLMRDALTRAAIVLGEIAGSRKNNPINSIAIFERYGAHLPSDHAEAVTAVRRLTAIAAESVKQLRAMGATAHSNALAAALANMKGERA